MTKTRAIVLAPHFAPGFKAGGPLRSLTAIVDTAPRNIEILVITSNKDLGDSMPYPTAHKSPVARGEHHVLYIQPMNLRHIARWIREARKFKPTIVYFNSLWNVGLTIIPLIGILVRAINPRQLAVAPRGQLSTPALRISSKRKSCALVLWRIVAKRAPLVWHATDEYEARQLRTQLGSKAPILTSLNPVNLPSKATIAEHRTPGPLRLLYVGRISPIKNVHTLLAGLIDSDTKATLTIVGPEEDLDYSVQIRSAAKILGDRVQILGPVRPSLLGRQFVTHDAMFFPSLSENFGHVIPESLSKSCPVVCGPVTPFTSIVEHGGGEIIAEYTRPQSWAKTIHRWSNMGHQELATRRVASAVAYERWHRQRDDTNILSILAKNA